MKLLHWIQRSPFLILLISLVTGILLQQIVFENVSEGIWWVLFAICFGATVFINLIKSINNNLASLRVLSVVITVVALGALLSYHQDIRHDKNWYGNYLKNATAIQLKISDVPESKEKTMYLPVIAENVLVNDTWLNTKGNLKLYVYKNDSLPSFKIGDKIILPNVLTPIKNSGNPFAFDYAAYASRNNLYHQAFIGINTIIYQPTTSAPDRLVALRKSLLESIENNVKDSTTASLIEAVLLNERSTLSDNLWKAYSVTGIVHIIAISGGHIVIFSAILLWLLSLILKNKKWEWLKYLLVVLFVWFYIAITAFPPSAVRAAVMFTLYSLGATINRDKNPINIWAATGFILLCINPNWLYDVGVQLSFLAVLSMMVFYKPICTLWIPRNKIMRIFWEAVSLSIAVQILVFPLVIYYFHQFPLWVLIANIPAALFSVLLMGGSLLLFLFSILGSCIWLGNAIIWITKQFHGIIIFLANITPRFFRELYIDNADYWLMMITIILMSVYFLQKKVAYLYAGLSTIILLIVSFIIQDIRAVKQKGVIVYNVSNISLIDYINGKHVSLSGCVEDSLDNKTYSYNLLPSRLGYRTTAIADNEKGKNLWSIKNKKVLLLNTDINYNTLNTFKVDYLIVSNPTSLNPELWLRLFNPEKIIIDSSLPRWKAKQWKEILLQKNIIVHSVQEDGAWVIGR